VTSRLGDIRREGMKCKLGGGQTRRRRHRDRDAKGVEEENKRRGMGKGYLD